MLRKFQVAMLVSLPALLCLAQVSGMARSAEKEASPAEEPKDDLQNIVRNEMRPCCYGEANFSHGEVVAIFAQVCLRLVCENGNIVPHFLDLGSCCEFDGELYGDGDKLPNQCLDLYCRNGVWHASNFIHECCRHCLVHDDPHFDTFDNHQYDMHGVCNYSLAQDDFSYNPDIGVFSDFTQCNSFASCLNERTFRNDPHTIITFTDDVTQLHANGHLNPVPGVGIVASVMTSATTTGPVLIWSDGSTCVFLAGSSGLLLRHCPYRLDIWAHPVHTGNLDGLCGHFNYFTPDDFTSRDEVVYPLSFWPPPEFPNSWLTADQSNSACNQRSTVLRDGMTNPCTLDDAILANLTDICTDAMADAARKVLQLTTEGGLNKQDLDPTHNFIETCVLDLCVMIQDNATWDEQNRWLEALKEIKILSCITSWIPVAPTVYRQSQLN